MKNGFLMYYEYEEHFSLLTDEEIGKLMRALFAYEKTGEVQELEGAVKMAFSFIRADLDKNREKYEQRCSKNAENAKRGGRPKTQTHSNETGKNQSVCEKANGFQKNQSVFEKTERFSEKAKKPDRESDSDSVSDRERDRERDRDSEQHQKEKQEKEKGGGVGVLMQKVCQKMQECWNMPLPSAHNVEMLCSYTQDRASPLSVDMVLKAVEIAAENNKPNAAYAKGILNNWKSKGYTSLDQVEQEKAQNGHGSGVGLFCVEDLS